MNSMELKRQANVKEFTKVIELAKNTYKKNLDPSEEVDEV